MARILPLGASFLEGLRGLDVVARRRAGGMNAGERTAARKGQGVEFADHRVYAPGDDPRFLDWNAYARLGRPVIKEFLEESDLAVTVVVDASASMGFGSPPRLDVGCTLASVLCRVALARHDRAGVGIAQEGEIRLVPPARGPEQTRRVEEVLVSTEPMGVTSLPRALSKYLSSRRVEGVVVLVSDLYDPAGPAAVVDCLVHFGVDARILMLQDDEDARLVPVGPVELVDGETGEAVRMLVTPEVLADIGRSVAAWRTAACAYAADHGVPCVPLDARRPVEALVADLAARGEVLRS